VHVTEKKKKPGETDVVLRKILLKIYKSFGLIVFC